jgi:hypothetical protein
VITGPGDKKATEHVRGRLRASHADREQAVEALKDAFAQGRLDKNELDGRLGQAFASRSGRYTSPRASCGWERRSPVTTELAGHSSTWPS